jgi:transcriptional regulator with XRE-family HTH domain
MAGEFMRHKYQFGEKIRAVRERKSLTLKEVAEKAGVSESLVSQIERNRVSPAIDTLLALADALEIDFDYLFAGLKRERPVTIVRTEERPSYNIKPGVLYEHLAQVDEQGGIEAYIITIEAGAHTGNAEYGHPGWELGIVESGVMELTAGNRSFRCKAGDSVSFRADTPHILSNPGKKPLRVFWVISPPKNMVNKTGR